MIFLLLSDFSLSFNFLIGVFFGVTEAAIEDISWTEPWYEGLVFMSKNSGREMLKTTLV